jgi:hypothetical protein
MYFILIRKTVKVIDEFHASLIQIFSTNCDLVSLQNAIYPFYNFEKNENNFGILIEIPKPDTFNLI